MTIYTPLLQSAGKHRLAGGWRFFDQVLVDDGQSQDTVFATDLPKPILSRLTAPRAPLAGMAMDAPQVMGILNVTPDSFSDGGLFDSPAAALGQVDKMVSAGAAILDIGGESTRPGADYVEITDEIARTAPVIAAITTKTDLPISIDTRKADVARAAIAAGATLINDVSALTFDADMVGTAQQTGVAVCLMHAQGLPKTMQAAPQYTDVVRDVLGELEARIQFAEKSGIARAQITIDPGIGFGKNLDHNLQLLQHLSAFHVLGCPILLGASRKKFIGTLTGVEDAASRMPGSVTVALHGIAQGVQITRVHDVAETVQAFRMWMALNA